MGHVKSVMNKPDRQTALSETICTCRVNQPNGTNFCPFLYRGLIVVLVSNLGNSLRSVVAIVLIAKVLWTEKNFLRSTRLIFNHNYSRQIVLHHNKAPYNASNRGDRTPEKDLSLLWSLLFFLLFVDDMDTVTLQMSRYHPEFPPIINPLPHNTAF